MSTSEFPFAHAKIPVTQATQGFQEFIESYPDYSVCPYVAHKLPEDWERSTSRVYMNQVLPHLLYVPVNIRKDDASELRRFFKLVAAMNNVPAVNITQPHKSAPVIREMFLGRQRAPENVDTLIRNQSGELEPYDLNAPAFVSWYLDEVGNIANKTVVLVGVGGVGEPIAKHIAAQDPAKLILVDPADKSPLASRLNIMIPTDYRSSLDDLTSTPLPTGIVVINAAGKEGATDDSGLLQLLQKNASPSNIFVDIRPHLDIEVVNLARKFGWQAFTGHGMNARNDYALLTGISSYLRATPLPFSKFQELVSSAS